MSEVFHFQCSNINFFYILLSMVQIVINVALHIIHINGLVHVELFFLCIVLTLYITILRLKFM